MAVLDFDGVFIYTTYQTETTFSNEVALCTHAKINGVTDQYVTLNSALNFYTKAGVLLSFDRARKIIKGEDADVEKRMAIGAQVANYSLQPLAMAGAAAEEFSSIQKAWLLRGARAIENYVTPWDLVTLKRDSDLSKVAVTLEKAGARYDRIHFLCCREITNDLAA